MEGLEKHGNEKSTSSVNHAQSFVYPELTLPTRALDQVAISEAVHEFGVEALTNKPPQQKRGQGQDNGVTSRSRGSTIDALFPASSSAVTGTAWARAQTA